MLRPYFLTLWRWVLADDVYQLSSEERENGIVRCEVFGWVDASLESVMTRSVLCLGLDIVFWESVFVQNRMYRVLELLNDREMIQLVNARLEQLGKEDFWREALQTQLLALSCP